MSSHRILILDDEKEISNLISVLLKRSGYEPVCCLTGEEAVDTFRQAEEEAQPFSLLIMDLTIPMGMGGKEALKAIREIRSDVLAVATSGYDASSAGATEAGFDHFVGKPFNIGGLRSMIEEILEGSGSPPAP